MEENSIQQRFLLIINELYGGNKRAFARAAGIRATVVENVVGARQGKPSFDVMQRICANANISAEWLLSGKGGMLKGGVPFHGDVVSIGGYNDSVVDVSGSHGESVEAIDVGRMFPGATAAIHHYGDSMVEYPSGSVLVLKRLVDPQLIVNGKNYVIETSEYRITKQLQDSGEDYLTAYSTNRETYPDGRLVHAPLRIPKSEIRHLDLVLGCIVEESVEISGINRE